MHWLEEQLRNTPPPEVIIHLGAGPCRELPLWTQTGAGRIVLVEPNPELLPELRQRASQHANIEVIEAAIAENSGRGALRLFNFPLLSSLQEPTGLYQSLPGLQQIGQAIVDLLAVEDLLAQLGIDKHSNNWLYIDTPAEEATVLQQLQRCGRLHDFSRIFLSGGCEPLYEGATAVPELLSLLASEGFEPAGIPDHSDVDWPRHHLLLNRMAVEFRQVAQELEQKEERLRSQTERANELASELEAQRAQAAALQESSASRIQELEALWNEAEYRKTEIEEKSQVQFAEAQKAHQDELRTLRNQLKEANEKSQNLADQAEKARADLSLALRLQVLRENDLKELQSRYAEVLGVKNEQEDLLSQLHHRLSRAAEYLKLVHSRSDSQGLPDEFLEALTGKGEGPN